MKTVVIMVLRIEHAAVLAQGMKRGMTIEYLMCREDFYVEVEFIVNCAVGTIVTKWDVILFG